MKYSIRNMFFGFMQLIMCLVGAYAMFYAPWNMIKTAQMPMLLRLLIILPSCSFGIFIISVLLKRKFYFDYMFAPAEHDDPSASERLKRHLSKTGFKKSAVRVFIISFIVMMLTLVIPWLLVVEGKISNLFVVLLITYISIAFVIYRFTGFEINHRLGLPYHWGRFGGGDIGGEVKIYRNYLMKENGMIDWLCILNKITVIVCTINLMVVITALIGIMFFPTQIIKIFHAY